MWTGRLSLGCRRITSGNEGDPYDPGATKSLVDTGFGRITQYACELFETDNSQYVSLPYCFLTGQVFFIKALSILLENALFYVWSSKNKWSPRKTYHFIKFQISLLEIILDFENCLFYSNRLLNYFKFTNNVFQFINLR